MSKPIKDLKDLRFLRERACYRHSGPTDLKRTSDVFSVVRAMARDRPSPYGEGGFSPPVARGPVPRECWSARTMARGTRSQARVACEGPRPTTKGVFCRRALGRRAALLHRDQRSLLPRRPRDMKPTQLFLYYPYPHIRIIFQSPPRWNHSIRILNSTPSHLF